MSSEFLRAQRASTGRGLVAAACALTLLNVTSAQPPTTEAERNRQKLEELIRQNQELQRQIDELRRAMEAADQIKVQTTPVPARAAQPTTPPANPSPAPAQPPATKPQSPQDALDAALVEEPAKPTGLEFQPVSKDLFSTKIGNSTLRLMDISLVADMAAGWSSESDDSLSTLQGGDHDPKKRGFTLQAAELGLAGAVDPYFYAQANIAYKVDPLVGETEVELEEMFAQTTSLPWGLQVKAGQYLTEFGLSNPTHPHTWDWLDQPIVNSRFFGGDGMRGVGARVGWLTPLPWYSNVIVGVQNSNGETMTSFYASEDVFAERAIGGRPFVTNHTSGVDQLAYSARWENFFELSDEVTLKAGVSAAFGPNPTGEDVQTQIYGADFKLKWRPSNNDRGWPFIIWQTEVMARNYEAAAYADPTNSANDLAGTTLHDWGFYTQLLYGFTPNWAAGVRVDVDGGNGDSVGGRDYDPFRDDRTRLSPLLVWDLSEFSRLRLQYNHDWADHIEGGDADSIYLGLEVLFGAHPAHSY